jgi:hypothetical protein
LTYGKEEKNEKNTIEKRLKFVENLNKLLEFIEKKVFCQLCFSF